jgi:preprotein translocase subunit YajC
MSKRIGYLAACSALIVGTFVIAGDLFAQDGGQVFSTPPTAGEQQPSLMQSLISMLPMLAICYLIFWVMVIRPQESKVKKHKALLESLKRGDSVITTGGIIGRVSSVEKDGVLVEIAPNVKVKFAQSHILGLEKGESKAEAA